MPRPDTRVRIAFDLSAGGSGDFFTLDDPVKGALSPYVAEVLADSPDYYHRMNEATDATLTAEVGSTGSYVGSPSMRAGLLSRDGNSVEFDGSTQRAGATQPSAETSSFTMEAWFSCDDVNAANFQVIFEEGGATNGVNLYVYDGSVYGIMYTGSTMRSVVSAAISSNTVYHVVYAYDDATPTTALYLNGVSVGTVTTNTGDPLTNHNDTVGIAATLSGTRFHDGTVTSGSGLYFFSGRIGDIAYYPAALSAARTLAHYEAGQAVGLAGDILEDVTADLRSITVRRGRSRELERYQAGAATIDLDNSERKYDPAAGTAITPYGASMRPRKAIAISANGLPVFTGVVDDWDLDYRLEGNHIASVKATDGFVFLANQEIEPHTASAGTTGERIIDILDRSEIAWPSGRRSIDDGVATLQADAIGGTADPKPVNALQYLQKVDEAEQGALFMAADGVLTFRDRSSLQVLTTTKFADDGTGIPFTNIEAAYGSEELRNRVTVSRLNGGTVTSEDAASIAAYGAIDYDIRDSLLADDTQAQALADLIVTRYAEPLLRIDSVEVVTNALTTAQTNEVLALELGDLVQIVYTPSGIGDAIDQFVRLDSIEHSIDAAQHRIKFSFSRGEGVALVLDSAYFGILDTNTLGY